ncbi:hypothetical protein BC628DRAFT_1406780 [Trametes gibbosa]|uniref:C3H1-type domain-containing protein n=1 Tax=Trametes gibbosa TaxID=160864 RepID=A0A6G6FQQ4_9APHY|nr:hypothetical protein BC628DRAFT_1406780 [Trametes gibbosa]QIE48550.1 hypothetical protein [Trametes gibbosa]
MTSHQWRSTTKLCRNFALGHCPQDQACNYIHASPATIQRHTDIHSMLDSGSNLTHGLRSSLATSPVYSTLSPVTNNSDQPNYQLGLSPAMGTTAVSDHIKYRSLSWRTALCRHFVKNKGWCPLGDECNYIHDLSLAEFAKDDARFTTRRSAGRGGGRHGSRGKMGSKHSHCWAYVQGLCHVQDCQYLHPVAVHLFAQHTPCLAWPNCRRGPLCPYKHPELYISDSAPPSPDLQATSEAPHTQRAALTQSDLISPGALPYNGMFYFNTQQPLLQSLPPPPQLRLPLPPQPPMMLGSPWQAWRFPYPPTPLTYVPVMMGPQASWPVHDTNRPLPDFNAATMWPPQVFPKFVGPSFNTEPSQSSPDSHSPNYTYEPIIEHPHVGALPVPDSDLPYIPSKSEPRAGHARRISVTIKNKEDLDALALDSGTQRRQPWQTHGDRVGRRVSATSVATSWAPSSSGLHGGVKGTLTPPGILYGM